MSKPYSTASYRPIAASATVLGIVLGMENRPRYRLNKLEIEEAFSKLDGRGSDAEFEAVDVLSKLGLQFPELLRARYLTARKWGERASCVYHSMKYAKVSQSACQLGIEALADRSKHVRYRACMLLALTQNEDAIHSLKKLLLNPESGPDAAAAICAIEHKNEHYFFDREHSGKLTLNISYYDETELK